MARALVSGIMQQLGSFIASEFKLTASVKEEIQKLESKFRTIQAVLNDAEKRQVKEEAVKLWLDKLKDISYKMDDVLDEWNTAMIKATVEKEEEEEGEAETSTAKKRKVLPLIPNINFSILQHRDFAHKIKELNGKLDAIVTERVRYGFELTTRGNAPEVVERPQTTCFVDVYEICGRDKVKDDLVSILLEKGNEEERCPHVISLVGMGGIGKTTLAQLAYNDPEVKSHFEKRIWVCVSEPFDQCRIAKAILEAFGGGQPNSTELQSQLEKICELIERKKFFLVLDDVWTEDATLWEPFRLALKYGAQGSRILVITRKIRVAEIMGSTSARMINLEVLSEQDCWLVFSKIAFSGKDAKKCEELEVLGRQIAKKCKGLPLAAKTIGSLMRFKGSREQWMNVLDSNLWDLEGVGNVIEKDLFASLFLSYYDLPSPLKRCFSFCAVFPKDYDFYIDDLVYMWMAHGYIDSKEHMELIGREYFENLAIRSFFQDFKKDEDDGQIRGCKMHDIVHDFAQLMTKNECFTINGDTKLGLDYKNARHLCFERLEEGQFPVSIYNAKNLRTLIFYKVSRGYGLSSFFQHFRCLRSLTLDCLGKNIPDTLENCIHLRYLNLLHYEAEGLPKTIYNLCNLQILKIDGLVNGCMKFPHGIGKLINLRHLILENVVHWLEYPRGFGRLTSLRRLSHFYVSGTKDGCKLGELKDLNQLKGSLDIVGLGTVVDVCEAENAQLRKKIHLHTLKLEFTRGFKNDRRIENDVSVLNALESPPNLKDLSISWYLGTTMSPNWTMALTKLKTLSLSFCHKLEHLPPLGKLPVLESLIIERCNSLRKVGVEFLGIESENKKEDNMQIFPNLKSLEFRALLRWEEWIGIGGKREEGEDSNITIMPRLQHLVIFLCSSLKSLPDFLRTIPLKELEINYSSILHERCQRGTGEEWPKISHIPNITIDVKYVQGDGQEVKSEFYLWESDEEESNEEEHAEEEFDKEQLGSFITSEFKLTASVKEDIQKLEIKFRTIQAVINDAEKRQVKEEAVKLWLDKLKDVSYEMDDVLNEWNTAMIKAAIEKEQDEEKAESSTAKKRKVPSYIPSFNFSILQHRDIAHDIKELHEKLDEIIKEREMYGFELTGAIEVLERPRTTSLVDVSEMCGRDNVKDDLVNILLGKGSEEERSPHVISLVGMGGIGKTTLAQLAYNDPKVQAYFSIKIWICVSDPFDQFKVAKEILESIKPETPNMTSFDNLTRKIVELITRKKFFLVLDDVWNEDSALWEPFKLILKNGAQGSRILATTRKSRVAEIMGSLKTSESMINLEMLSKEDCWLVFRKIAFLDRDPNQCEQLEDLGRKIAKKCKGLPLAAKTLGSLMRFQRSREEWEMVLGSSLWELEDVGRVVEKDLFGPLLLSYNDLPSSLKQCFSFCAVFPKDYVFNIDDLVYMWMAHGYIDSKEHMELKGREYFENLAIRSFFQDFKEYEVGCGEVIIRFKMHDIVHDFAQSITKNKCFTINDVTGLKSDYRNAHHLHLEIQEVAQFPSSIYSAKNLRTLILKVPRDYRLSDFFQHFRCLRTLILVGQKELSDILGNCIHLRFLFLRNYLGDELPETICDLCNLQVLKISSVFDEKEPWKRHLKMPQGLGKLINLRHLIIMDELQHEMIGKLPRGIGKCISLRTLQYFEVNEECKLSELKNLNNLRGTLKIGMRGNRVNVREAENAQLKNKIHLRTLDLQYLPIENTNLVMNALEPPPNLEYLSIGGFGSSLTTSPNWMISLNELKMLRLMDLDVECLPSLGKLPSLETLEIMLLNSLKKVGVEFLGIEFKNNIIFPKLKHLHFLFLRKWEEWIGIEGMKEEEEEDCITIMPHLQILRILRCPNLNSLPDFLRKTPLEELTIARNPILKERCERGTGEDWPKISHIPNIMIDGNYAQRDGQEDNSECPTRFPFFWDKNSYASTVDLTGINTSVAI